jgi:hypothetical protein
MPDGMGIQASGASTINVIGNQIHDLGSVCTGLGPGYCHGIYAADNTQNWLVEKNAIYNSGGYGIHLYGTGATLPSGFIIRRNITHNNGVPGVNGAGIIAYGANHQIYNNISYANAYEGILLRSSTNALICNNTTYKNGAGGISKESGSGAICKNNLTLGDGTTEIAGCDTASNNLATGLASSNFVNASADDFHLIFGSPALDAGTNLSPTVTTDFDGVARPQGSAYDIGAYEFVSGSRCDLNGDGSVNSIDLQALVNAILSASTNSAYDLNKDGLVSVLDAQYLVNVILRVRTCS